MNYLKILIPAILLSLHTPAPAQYTLEPSRQQATEAAETTEDNGKNGIPERPIYSPHKLINHLESLDINDPEQTVAEIILHEDLHPIEAVVANNCILHADISATLITEFDDNIDADDEGPQLEL